ncbi:MAG TPA: hypothetical protein VFS59_00125 [Gemmatimonadaceae bacterium]|nr:hypothetical protein [Gemmatimonadaceae bacterium]
MPISSCTARFAWAGRLLTSPRAALALLAACTATLGAQTSTPRADDWSIDAQYLQLAPQRTDRAATPSLAVVLARRVGGGALAWRGEAGWARAVRGGTTAQGVTVGLSAGVPVASGAGRRLVVRPGVAMLAGWAESQDSSALYAWRGLDGTADAGTNGTQFTWNTVRGRTIAVGGSLEADLALTRSFGVAASVRQWRLGGRAADANPNVTLVGIGVTAEPRTVARAMRRWWRGERSGPRHQAERDRDDVGAMRAERMEAGR